MNIKKEIKNRIKKVRGFQTDNAAVMDEYTSKYGKNHPEIVSAKMGMDMLNESHEGQIQFLESLEASL